MNGFVLVRLMGGLGNQLFQYAAGLLQTRTTGSKLYLLKAENSSHDSNDYRNELFTQGEKYDDFLPQHVSLYQENGFTPWNPLDYDYPILLLYGYFQNYVVLKNILPEFKNHILNNLKDKTDLISHKYKIVSNSGFIHVRRGDYLTTSFTLKNLDYYTKAIQYFTNIKMWYIFSDDLEWCERSKLFDNIQTVYVKESDPLLSLALMSKISSAAIIGNSTFSWMGAYLGCGTSNVSYPKEWINSGTPDLFPEDWVGL